MYILCVSNVRISGPYVCCCCRCACLLVCFLVGPSLWLWAPIRPHICSYPRCRIDAQCSLAAEDEEWNGVKIAVAGCDCGLWPILHIIWAAVQAPTLCSVSQMAHRSTTWVPECKLSEPDPSGRYLIRQLDDEDGSKFSSNSPVS